MSLEFLERIGLTKKEAVLYSLLLSLGEVPVRDLVKQTKFKRATIYKTLSTLKDKGLVSQKKKDKKIHFRPEPPDRLLTLAERQYDALERAKEHIQTILPKLTSEYTLAVEKPVVTTFEGEEGIKKIFADIYAPKDEPVYGCVDLEASNQALPDYVMKKLIPLRVKNNVHAKSFIAKSKTAAHVQSKDSLQKRESVLLDKNAYPLPAEVDVYEDKVAFLSFERGKFIGMLIQNKAIATSLKSIFKLAFKRSHAQDQDESSES